MKASNDKYVMAAATGHMKAISDNVTDLETFKISLVNRPILVLKCEYGLIGYKNKTTYKLECNKSTFNVIMVEESKEETGYYYLKGKIKLKIEFFKNCFNAMNNLGSRLSWFVLGYRIGRTYKRKQFNGHKIQYRIIAK